jgi:NAD(P)H-dependent flavin oxidoreductase YrpB (nitropropane dioxygenase family)
VCEPALAAGATGVVAGTRFLLSDESAAHLEYKRRAMEASRTVLTEVFGFGWPAPHRVIPNGVTDRWLLRDPRAGPITCSTPRGCARARPWPGSGTSGRRPSWSATWRARSDQLYAATAASHTS